MDDRQEQSAGREEGSRTEFVAVAVAVEIAEVPVDRNVESGEVLATVEDRVGHCGLEQAGVVVHSA